MLITRRLALIVTLKCTLNCRLCCNCVPMYRHTPILSKQDIFSDIKECFKLYDRIEWFQFVGGELFLHPDLGEILEEAFKYDNQFDKIILMTNGTLVPKENVVRVLKEHSSRVEVQISDYGQLSYKIEELKTKLSENNIPFVVKSFHGDIQHYGGWVDCGGFEDRNFSDDQQKETWETCWQIKMQNLHMYNGKIHNCIRSLFGLDLNKVDIPESEYIDLRSSKYTLEEKRKIASQFNKKPLTACNYCNGFNSEKSERYPAAEQI